jgi:hypothetical protein
LTPNAGHLTKRDYLRHTSLEFRDDFICLIASLCGRVNEDKKPTVLGSPDDPDQVMRCCYYGRTILEGKELQAAFDRDEEVFIFATMQNISMPSTAEVKTFIEKEMRGREMIRLYHKRLKQSQERWGGDAKAETEWGAELMEDLLPKKTEEHVRIQALEKQIDGDRFALFDETGPMLDSIAPNLAHHLFGIHRRVVMSDGLNDTMQREAAKILALAPALPPGGALRSRQKAGCKPKRAKARTCLPRKRSRIC